MSGIAASSAIQIKMIGEVSVVLKFLTSNYCTYAGYCYLLVYIINEDGDEEVKNDA